MTSYKTHILSGMNMLRQHFLEPELNLFLNLTQIYFLPKPHQSIDPSISLIVVYYCNH